MDVVRKTVETSCPCPKAPDFLFSLDKDAAKHNLEVLKGHNFDLKLALKAQHGTPLSYGSEFRPTSALATLHPEFTSQFLR